MSPITLNGFQIPKVAITKNAIKCKTCRCHYYLSEIVNNYKIYLFSKVATYKLMFKPLLSLNL